nr:holo-ACP synthase [Bacillus subtilis]
MIYGIGLDITELKRIASMAGRQKRFAERILTRSELDQYYELSEKRKIEFLAGRFAAKEAFSKAFGRPALGGSSAFRTLKLGKTKIASPISFARN